MVSNSQSLLNSIKKNQDAFIEIVEDPLNTFYLVYRIAKTHNFVNPKPKILVKELVKYNTIMNCKNTNADNQKIVEEDFEDLSFYGKQLLNGNILIVDKTKTPDSPTWGLVLTFKPDTLINCKNPENDLHIIENSEDSSTDRFTVKTMKFS